MTGGADKQGFVIEGRRSTTLREAMNGLKKIKIYL